MLRSQGPRAAEALPRGPWLSVSTFELTVAVVVALFGATCPAALAATVDVLTEVPVMLTLVKIANKTPQPLFVFVL